MKNEQVRLMAVMGDEGEHRLVSCFSPFLSLPPSLLCLRRVVWPFMNPPGSFPSASVSRACAMISMGRGRTVVERGAGLGTLWARRVNTVRRVSLQGGPSAVFTLSSLSLLFLWCLTCD
jgi:hypothetical protein